MRILKIALTAVALVAFCLGLQAGAGTYYVSPQGDNGYNGLSPDSAWRNVSYAAFQVGGNRLDPDTVLVYPGLYDIIVGEVFPVRVRSYTALVGLDTGCTLSARDTSKVEVIRISGGRHINIRNLEITAGNGGINALNCSRVLIEDNYIHHNQRRTSRNSTLGAGIALLEAREVTIRGNLVLENEVSGSQIVTGGGGVGIGLSSNVTVDSNTVYANRVEYEGVAVGGGLALSGCDSIDIRYNTIDSNLVRSSTDKPQSLGGGIYLAECGEVTILENRICQNVIYGQAPEDTCVGHGRGIYVADGSGQINITGNLISSNYSVGNCDFAHGDGGGVKVDNAHVSFLDNTVEDNEAGYGSRADGWGGGVCVDSQSVCCFFHNRIFGNRAGSGGGIGAYFPDSLVVGGAPGLGNDLYDNVAERGDALWRYLYAPPETLMATFNYFGGEPNVAKVYPFEFWDVSFWRDSLIDVNEPPHILDYSPTFVETTIDIGDTLLFWVEVLDYDGDSTLTSWYLNGGHLADGDSLLFIADSEYAGYDTMQVAVTDLEDTTSHYWYMQVGPMSVPSDDGRDLPRKFALYDNYPNPFNASTIIRYELPRACDVRLEIFDVLGRKVATLVDEKDRAGYRFAIWNADKVTSGFYFCKLTAGGFVATKRMVLLK